MFKLSDFYNVTIICGLARSGKTTIACAISKWWQKNYGNVYSTVPILDTYKFTLDMLGHVDIDGTHDKPTLVIFDESGIDFDNRATFTKDCVFKDKAVLEWLKLIGHRHIYAIFLSQSWEDMDLKIRAMAGRLYIVRKSLLPWWSTMRAVNRKIVVNPDTHKLDDEYKDALIAKRIFRRKYYKMFDSFECRKLPPCNTTKYSKLNRYK